MGLMLLEKRSHRHPYCVRTQREGAGCDPGGGPHQNVTVPEPDHRLPASRAVRNEFLSFVNQPVLAFCDSS